MQNGEENDIQSRILDFFYLCSRHPICELGNSFQELISFIRTHRIELQEKYIHKLFCLICYIRDKKGKGQRDVSYRMIYDFSFHYSDYAKELIRRFVGFNEERPYGSWKDIKYFCNFIYESTNNPVHPLIEYCIELVCQQLRIDLSGLSGSVSLCAKWVPREKSKKFGWLFKQIAVRYIPTYYLTANSQFSAERAYRKTFAEFSKILSRLNRQLQTIEIHMCENKWDDIANIPYAARRKYKSAFEEREQEQRVRPRRMIKFNEMCLPIHTAMSLWSTNRYSDNKMMEFDIYNLNRNWNTWIQSVDCLSYMIPVMDQSPSLCAHHSIPLYTSVGLSLTLSQCSIIKDRILTFSRNPKWIFCKPTFYETICEIMKHGYIVECTLSFYKIYKLLLDACIEQHITEENVRKMVITVFTNTHIHMADALFDEMMYHRILEMYKVAGYRFLPNILFWDLQRTDLSCMYIENYGVTIYMMTGYNDSIVRSFCKYGIDAMHTPFQSLSVKLEPYSRMI